MGNSEVGHLNIGAGRVVKQWLVRISDGFKDQTVRTAEPFQTFLNERKPGGKIHIVGMYSFGGVHSEASHLFSLLSALADTAPDAKVVLHLISDGRDTAPQQILYDLPALKSHVASIDLHVEISSLTGRFYSMDRDNRWERTEKGYQNLTVSTATPPPSLESSFSLIENGIKDQYQNGTTDEFLEPIQTGSPSITADDSVIFWNYRSDRMRQLVQSFTAENFDSFPRTVRLTPSQTLCFTEYNKEFALPVLFPPTPIAQHLGQVIADSGARQLRIAETEKYPHVTYFLNGGVEEPLPGEDRTLIPSPRDVKTYDQKPEMSAYEVTDKVLEAILSDGYQLIVLNFANGDMVGHTGDIEAATKAVEVVDLCLGKILQALGKNNGNAVIIADHGNAEQMIDYDSGEPHTAHTTYPVPAILFSDTLKDVALASDGALCDVAPTVLELLELAKPAEMTGTSLIRR